MFGIIKKLEHSGVVYSSRRSFKDKEKTVADILTYVIMKEYSHTNFFTEEKNITRKFEIKQSGGAIPGYGCICDYDYNIAIEKMDAELWIEKHRYDKQLKYLE
jgi:hypothetical protein